MTLENVSGTVLVVGSAPDATRCRDWPKALFSSIVAINNAWRIRDDWDYLAFPDDFPPENRPTDLRPGQDLIRSDSYVPSNNRFGGVLYAGGTMAFSTGYWALDALRPAVLAFVGCDMVYPTAGRTHFYGKGTADPLREDISLRNLEAKSARLSLHAAMLGCACVRLSSGPSRLTFPQCPPDQLASLPSPTLRVNGAGFRAASEEESRLGYTVESGRYWEHEQEFSTDRLDALDRMWLRAAQTEPG